MYNDNDLLKHGLHRFFIHRSTDITYSLPTLPEMSKGRLLYRGQGCHPNFVKAYKGQVAGGDRDKYFNSRRELEKYIEQNRANCKYTETEMRQHTGIGYRSDSYLSCTTSFEVATKFASQAFGPLYIAHVEHYRDQHHTKSSEAEIVVPIGISWKNILAFRYPRSVISGSENFVLLTDSLLLLYEYDVIEKIVKALLYNGEALNYVELKASVKNLKIPMLKKKNIDAKIALSDLAKISELSVACVMSCLKVSRISFFCSISSRHPIFWQESPGLDIEKKSSRLSNAMKRYFELPNIPHNACIITGTSLYRIDASEQAEVISSFDAAGLQFFEKPGYWAKKDFVIALVNSGGNIFDPMEVWAGQQYSDITLSILIQAFMDPRYKSANHLKEELSQISFERTANIGNKLNSLIKSLPKNLNDVMESVGYEMPIHFCVARAYELDSHRMRIISLNVGNCMLIAYDPKRKIIKTISGVRILSSPNEYQNFADVKEARELNVTDAILDKAVIIFAINKGVWNTFDVVKAQHGNDTFFELDSELKPVRLFETLTAKSSVADHSKMLMHEILWLAEQKRKIGYYEPDKQVSGDTIAIVGVRMS